MKTLGRGPITRLARVATNGTPGAVYSRDDWNSGRDLATEEHRCGMVTRLSDIHQAESAGTPRLSSSSPDAVSPRRLEAVARAQSTDTQLSEIDSTGHGAFLEKAPRGRWRKISRAKALLVEDTATPFSNPDKSFAPRVQSYGEYVRRIGKLPEGQPLLRFVLYRDGYSLESVRHRFHYEIGVPAEALYLQPTPGGSFGAITQFGVAVGVTREQLPHVSRRYNVHPLVLDDRTYHGLDALASLTAAPQGHLHRVVLRCVDGDEAAVTSRLRRLHTDGFINYVGVEHFGIGSNTLFDMAAAAHGEAVQLAVGGYLQTLAESSPLHHQAYLAYANAEGGTTAGAIGEWRRLCERAKLPRALRDTLRVLQQYHLSPSVGGGIATGTTVSLQDVWATCALQRSGEESAGAFVWNAMASQRLLAYGSRPVKGDLVRRASVDGDAMAVSEIASDAEASRCSIEDVVLPMPQRGGSLRFPSHRVNAELFAEFAAKHHLSFLFDQAKSTAMMAAAPLYRPVVCRPSQMQAAVLHDPTSCAALKSDHFLLQERQPTESWSLDYERRVREPSPFSVSERFREKMQLMRRSHAGEHTVVLSFVLPAGASPWVALRDVFDLRYGTFHDLYGLD